jgi:hypothetical protein
VPGGTVTGGKVTVGPVPAGFETLDPLVALDGEGVALPDPLLHAPTATSAKTGK